MRTLLVLLILLAACTFSCRRGPDDGVAGAPPGAGEASSVEDSGKRLNGEYVLKGKEDEYANKSSQSRDLASFRFDEAGGFTIERGAGDTAAGREEGTYVIGRGGELVLYVEKVGGEALSEARIFRYVMSDQGDGAIRLKVGQSVTLTLQKKQ